MLSHFLVFSFSSLSSSLLSLSLSLFSLHPTQAHRHVSAAALERALEALVESGVLSKETRTRPEDLIHSNVAELMPMDIKKVRLYNGSKKIIRQLNYDLNRLHLASGPLTSLQLQELDQRHHYGGVSAVDEAIQLCQLQEGAKVINIGSGLGGPSRHVASTVSKSEVLAIELQHDLHSHAQMLTDRCALGDRVTHMAGDFLEVEKYLTKGAYDAIVSWLTVLHFTNRLSLFQSCYDLLRPGGTMYIADLCAVSTLSVRERQDMRSEV